MKKIILTVLSATLLLAATIAPTENKKQETTEKSRDAILADKQIARAAKIEAKLVKRELARVAKTKEREEKIQKRDTVLKEKAVKRAQA